MDQRCQDGRHHAEHGIHDRIEFERDDAVVCEQLVESVERCDGGDVARAEYHADTVRAAWVELRETGTALCGRLVDSRLQPHLCAEPVEQ